eukprot:TRINITY_DN18514_c0_g1_i2.p1 TRINITY_DN18514_c0_g1~~TRINITY_DN18514_c0_g1_i2.p1  ORF type:complete len:647 (-),score=140.70 TRINITY_DN18514_c0_g1_i2:533-2473(-)
MAPHSLDPHEDTPVFLRERHAAIRSWLQERHQALLSDFDLQFEGTRGSSPRVSSLSGDAGSMSEGFHMLPKKSWEPEKLSEYLIDMDEPKQPSNGRQEGEPSAHQPVPATQRTSRASKASNASQARPTATLELGVSPTEVHAEVNAEGHDGTCSCDANASTESRQTVSDLQAAFRITDGIDGIVKGLLPMESAEKPEVPQLRSKKTETKVVKGKPWQVKDGVNSPRFEVLMSVIICLNAVAMGLELQVKGMCSAEDMGFTHRYWDSCGVDADTVTSWFWWLEFGFGSIFTMEVVVKLASSRRNFFCSFWDIYDLTVVACWTMDVVFKAYGQMNPLLFRVLKLVRLWRLLRFVKAFQVFDVLHLLTASLQACGSVLFWSTLLLTVILVTSALVMGFVVEPSFTSREIELEQREELFSYFGTFSRGILSMFELTLGNWVPITRLLVDHVSEWFTIVIMLFRVLVGEAVVKVINGIFFHETFRVASSDNDIMIMQKERAARKHIERMNVFLEEGDTNNDGALNFDEFSKMLEDDRVRKWLSAQEVDVKDAKLAFRILDENGDGELDVQDLVHGFARLKGPSKSVEMIAMLHAVNVMESHLQHVRLLLGDKSQRTKLFLNDLVSGHYREDGPAVHAGEKAPPAVAVAQSS